MPKSCLDPGEKKKTVKDTFQTNGKFAYELYIRCY